MIRFILVLLFFLFYLILTIPVLLVEWIISKFNQNAADVSSQKMVQWAFRVVRFLSGTKLTILGKENIPTDQAVLYVPNHQSYFDIILTYPTFPRPTGYVAKDAMLKFPLLNLWMKRVRCLFINRENVKEALKTILAGIDLIKSGISVCIFPEGTRNHNPKELLPFKEGSLKMAEKSGCPIIPVAITNSAEVFENHLPKIKRCHVIIEYGAPIHISELEKEEKKFLGAYTQKKIQEMLAAHESML